MFIKRTTPQETPVKVSKNLSRCSKCGSPVLGSKMTKTGSTIENELICEKCNCENCEPDRIKNK